MSDTGLPEDPNGPQPAEGAPLGAPPVPPLDALPEGATAWGWEPAQPAKVKPLWGWFALGLFGVWAGTFLLSALIGFAAYALSTVAEQVTPALSALGGLPSLLFFGLSLFLFLKGRTKGDNRMRSLGLGGLMSYAIGLLIALLLFGSCLLVVGGSGGM